MELIMDTTVAAARSARQHRERMDTTVEAALSAPRQVYTTVEAALSAPLEVLLDKIVSSGVVDFCRRSKLDVALLERTLLSVKAVLNDAEEKQITDPTVKEWMDQVRDAVFEAEDLFDEINTEALRCKVEAQYQGQTVTAKVRNILSSPFKRSYRGINSKMEELFKILGHLAQDGHRLGLREGVSSDVLYRTPPTTSLIDHYSVCGRDSDIKKLKELLLHRYAYASDGYSKIGVIPIVGMGGVGKTTLAQLLYNDPEVEVKFDLKGWAHISEDFDIVGVTKSLLESVTSKRSDTDDLIALRVQLQQSLSHKKFLLVLDDVWDASYVDWNNLKDIFNAGDVGSRIIITTRVQRVALTMQTFLPIYPLLSLEHGDCWSILAEHAFAAGNHREWPYLEAIGKEIANMCDGLPLAAVALGDLLRAKQSQIEWIYVLRSNIFMLPNVGVLPALLLSYHYLPTPLKRCFGYCSIFPKKSVLEKKTVVQLWIAEGLVHQSNSQKSWEKVGEEYFDELVSRSLIRQRSVDGEECFEMHDLVNDLATKVSSPYCIRFDEQKVHESLKKVRYLSYNRVRHDSYNKFDKLYGLKDLRTFLALPLQEPWWLHYSISAKAVHDLLKTMKKLRVLSLSNYGTITELPNSIGNLIYLRYLNLSNASIERLPSETCTLYNLQTLLLSNCWCLTKLPEDIGKLVNLCHLDVSDTGLNEMPVQIANLENLQTLSDFVVSKQRDGLKVASLGKFSHLQGKLSISELQNVTDPSDAFQADLKTKEQIDKLKLHWDPDCSTTQSLEIQSLVLEKLQPSTNLKYLTIEGYGGTNFPNWLGDPSFGNIVSLRIWGCTNCSWLPPVGQLCNLKELYICCMESIKSVGAEFYGSSCPSSHPFASLETLHFEEMPKWEEWTLTEGTTIEFPILRHLSMKDCPKLKGKMPTNLPLLTALELRACPLLLSRHSDDNRNIINPLYVFSQLMLPPNYLRKLTIEGISSPTSFPRDSLPKTLQSLTIRYCENLEFLSLESLHNYTSLEEMTIFDSCWSMTSFTLGSLPVLNTLTISGCKNLKMILIAEDALQSLLFLRSIQILDCDELESFSPEGLPTPNLIHLEVSTCKKLHSIPEPINTQASLRKLGIRNLPNLQSFAKEGLPIKLQELTAANVRGILCNTAITEWGLERLCFLSVLRIEGDDMVNALMKVELPLLPTSLVFLKISHLNDIKWLDGKWLRHLTSLQNLQISDAPKLKSLPEEGLPSSLFVLTIDRCPLLEASLRRKEWHNIARIPSIVINHRMIT